MDQPTKFDLVINLKMAKSPRFLTALGPPICPSSSGVASGAPELLDVTIPESVLLQADEVRSVNMTPNPPLPDTLLE